MKIETKHPCHETPVALTVKATGETSKIDRKCPVCGCWWRVDVRHIKDEPGKTFHAAEWTRIGHL